MFDTSVAHGSPWRMYDKQLRTGRGQRHVTFLNFSASSYLSNWKIHAFQIRHTPTQCLKNVPPVACYNFDIPEQILIFWHKCYR